MVLLHGLIHDGKSELSLLARQISRAIEQPELKAQLSVDHSAFIQHNPYHALDSYFQRLEKVLGAVAARYRCFDYWSPFFTSILICVSFFSPEATEHLILQAGDIAYENNVVPEIIPLTNGQPYLVQLIGYTLIRFFNRNSLGRTLNVGESPVFNVADLYQLIESAEFYTIDNAYFQGVWLQALHGQPSGQASILQQLAHQPRSKSQLLESMDLPEAALNDALQALQNHDVLRCENEMLTYTVALMRRWVQTYQPL